MADRSVRVILSAVTTRFSAGMAKASADTQKLAGAVKENSASFSSMGTASMLAGAALAAGVGVAVKAYANFDQQMSAVAATGKDARDNLDQLRQAALDAGRDTAFSATEAAQGVENLLKAGVSAADVYGGGLSGALSLAAAGTMDVGDAAETAAMAMTQFKLQGSDVPHIADLLAAGAGKAQGEVSDMAMALKQGGLVASQFGLSIEETTGTLSAFASAGLIGSDAGTSFKQMLLSLASPSQKSAQLMTELGIAAYDAEGRFVGISDLAQQLKDRLGPLSDAQRQAALSTIFGSDAMRAASVLYDQGSAGIDKWTAAVNDQGYAAEAAATKMNNLSGDLEQLRGSIEAALIKAGEQADGPLRGLVQGVTGLVNAASEAPPELQAFGMGVAGVGSAALISVGGVMKLASAAAELKSNLAALKVAGSTAGLTMGALGVALTIAGVALSSFLASQAQKKEAVDSFTEAVKGQTNAINENSRSVAVKTLQDMGALDAAKRFGIALSEVTDASLGDADARARVNAEMQRQLGLLGQQATATPEQVRSQGELVRAADILTKGIGGTNDAFNTGVQAARDFEAAAAETAAGTGTAALTMGSFRTATDSSAVSSAKLAAQIQAQTAEVQKATQAFLDNANAQLQASGTQIGLEAAIDAATASVKEHGENVNLDTEAGRANMTALNGIASSALSLREAQERAGASTETMTASTNRAREAFIATAEKMGYAHDEAVRLADAYGLVPPTVVTNVSAPGAVQAKDEADAAAQAARNADGTTATITITTNRITNIITRSDSQTVGGSLMGTYAGGGSIRGPGTATSDSIPAWLSNGEFVLRAAAVDKIGLDRLWYMNRFGELPAFNRGGEVHFSNAAPRYAGGGSVSASSVGPSIADLADAIAARVNLNGSVLTIADPGNYLANHFQAVLELAVARQGG